MMMAVRAAALALLAGATASAAFVPITVALIGIVGTLGGIYLAWRLQQVHTIVNSQHAQMEERANEQDARIAQLEATIRSSDKDVPPTTRATGPPVVPPPPPGPA